jgi:hypothetical protein
MCSSMRCILTSGRSFPSSAPLGEVQLMNSGCFVKLHSQPASASRPMISSNNNAVYIARKSRLLRFVDLVGGSSSFSSSSLLPLLFFLSLFFFSSSSFSSLRRRGNRTSRRLKSLRRCIFTVFGLQTIWFT